jgi:hypothetical protein
VKYITLNSVFILFFCNLSAFASFEEIQNNFSNNVLTKSEIRKAPLETKRQLTNLDLYDFSKSIELYSSIKKMSMLDTAQNSLNKNIKQNTWMISGERGSGGGGDIGICKEGSHSSVKSLDFILRNRNIQISPELASLASCSAIMSKVVKTLSLSSPKLAIGLNGFIQDLNSSLDGDILNKERVFNFTKSPLIEMNDEMFNSEELNKCSVKQAGIRLPLPDFIHYSINVDAFNMLKSNPLQCSYFLTHEWLRDLFHEASKIRPIVHILHSKIFFEDSSILQSHIGLDSKLFESALNNYTVKDYFNDIRPLGNLAYNDRNLKERLNKFKGTYLPINEEDCKKTVSIKNKKLSVSHLISCDDPTTLTFDCTGFNCKREMFHPSCDNFSLEVKLNGFYSNMEIAGNCDGQRNIVENLYVKKNFATEFEKLRNGLNQR